MGSLAAAGLLGPEHLQTSQMLALQRLVGNAAVTALLAEGDRSSVLRRQLAVGRHRVTTKARLRADNPAHSELAALPPGNKVDVRDKGPRTSLFKAGWVENEHSWSEAPGPQYGWIEDGKLEPTLTGRLEARIAAGTRPNLVQLRALVLAATPAEREEAADDDAFLARVKAAVDEDTYLGLLPALGVHKAPTSAATGLGPGGAKHMSAAEADKEIRARLQQYLALAVKSGRKVEGEVSIVGDDDFQAAFDRQWVRAAGQNFGTKKAWEVCPAFCDVNLASRHIWVHRDRGTEGTVIHEGMHKYSSSVLRDEQIANCKIWNIDYQGTSRLDEGITEYFTRKVVSQLPMVQRVGYQNEWEVADNLAGRCGEPALAKAYFDGTFGPVKAVLGRDWDAFSEHLERKDWAWLRTNGYR